MSPVIMKLESMSLPPVFTVIVIITIKVTYYSLVVAWLSVIN